MAIKEISLNEERTAVFNEIRQKIRQLGGEFKGFYKQIWINPESGEMHYSFSENSRFEETNGKSVAIAEILPSTGKDEEIVVSNSVSLYGYSKIKEVVPDAQIKEVVSDIQQPISDLELKKRIQIDTYYDKQRTVSSRTKNLIPNIKNEKIQKFIEELVKLDSEEIAEERRKIFSECGFNAHKIQMPKFKTMWKKATDRGKRRTKRIEYLNKLTDEIVSSERKN